MQNKVCAKCGAAVAADAKFCTTCGSSEFAAAPAAPVQAAAPVAAPAKKPFPTWAKVLIIIGIIIFVPVACTVACTGALFGAAEEGLNELEENINSSYGDENESSDSGYYTVNKAFTFDDLEITVGDDILFTTVSNQYSEHNGKSVVKIPVTVKNLKSETHSLNMFFYSVYGANGTEVSNVSTLWITDKEDVLDYAGDLRTGASYTKYIYAIYDGDGTYAIEFNDFSTKITVEVEVAK
jgi:hypothetical protein